MWHGALGGCDDVSSPPMQVGHTALHTEPYGMHATHTCCQHQLPWWTGLTAQHLQCIKLSMSQQGGAWDAKAGQENVQGNARECEHARKPLSGAGFTAQIAIKGAPGG